MASSPTLLSVLEVRSKDSSLTPPQAMLYPVVAAMLYPVAPPSLLSTLPLLISSRIPSNCHLSIHLRQQVSNFGKRLRSKTRSPATVQKSLNLTVPVLQEEIVPLSGNSFFTFVISKSLITSYRMVIPHHFCQLLPDCNVPATLYCGNRTWEVKYCGSDEPKRFSTGWKSFVNDTKISLGDGCVFELMDKEKLHFRVQILRAQLPVLAAEGGDTSDSPIVID